MKFGNRWIMMFSRLFIPLYFVLCIQTTNGQTSCPGDYTIGEQNTQSKKTDSYKDDTVNAVLNFDSKYKFDCCGFISKWEIFVRKNPGTLNVKVQVWYDSGTIWTLRGENDITATDDNKENEITISTGSRIRVFEDDYIGFYEYAGSVITYGNGGNNYKTATFASNETTYNWTAEALDDKRDHAIHARITQSQIPTFTNLNDTVAISNNEVAGTVLFTLDTFDSDPEDAGLLTVAHASSSGSAATFFELDSTTSEVKIKSGVSLSPGDHSMTFNVTNPCSRSSSGILTIRVENDPPVITSLATNSSTTISEDLTAETLLHTLTVTDSTPTTCQLDSTGVPFQIKIISGSTSKVF
ncbi:unnamed protein product [Mytilus coruscus]|uniref:Cadherin domain-containing protein n=1 Tax=Mytilus coruscus TaxID=42192 RepID=A0A6J8AX84_MYTCO|nr:unnamed protein product [Mytilus coruscus]